MGYELVVVEDPTDWQAYHAIRRVELFENKGRHGIYDDRHPDDLADFATPYLLKLDGRPIGTTRLDRRGQGEGVFRLVAVTSAEQGRDTGGSWVRWSRPVRGPLASKPSWSTQLPRRAVSTRRPAGRPSSGTVQS